ncbi:unnamed protein product [Arabis nemorensis]|uniref:Multifunctional fusion protein n=1 Tax=Arabis nemorensis TaxID=586526 RepID=A0A565BGZ4_9BRAS|nr:unnamed protein product [Arabis nemorensis]
MPSHQHQLGMNKNGGLTTILYRSPSTPRGSPPGQLTIFYAGSVSVYEDISTEKADAIMLLAGNGPQAKPVPMSKSQKPVHHSLATIDPPTMHPSFLPFTSYIVSETGSGSNGVTRLGGSKTMSSLASTPQNDQTDASNMVPSVGLPQARKASLTRFLEKRKERVINVSPYYVDNKSSVECRKPISNVEEKRINTVMVLRQLCLQMEPMKLMNTKKNVDKLGFRRVVCKGIFDKKISIYVGPKPRRSMENYYEKGFYVITPLLPILNEPNSVKSPILVNRRWVPSDWKEESQESTEIDIVAITNRLRKADKLLSSQQNFLSKFLYKLNKQVVTKDQEVSSVMHEEVVVGMVRKSEVPGIFVLPNDPSSGK